MRPAKRLLKPKAVQGLLDKAARLAGAGCRLRLSTLDELGREAPLAMLGTGAELLEPGTAGAETRDLLLEGLPAARLVLAAGTGRSEQAPDIASLLAESLEVILEREHALRSVAAETLDKYRELELLYRGVQGLSNSLRLTEVADALLAECARLAIPFTAGMVFLREPETGEHPPIGSYGPAVDSQMYRLPTSRLFQDILSAGRGEIAGNLERDPRWQGELPGMRSLILVPLSSPNLRVGALALASPEPSPFSAAHLRGVRTIAAVAGSAMANAFHFEGVQVLMDALLQALATAIDARDPFTAGHSQRVAVLAVALGRAVGTDELHFHGFSFSDAELYEIFYAGLLHDVGKIGVREQVLTKDARLPAEHIDVIGLRLSMHAARNGGGDWKQELERLRTINRAGRLSVEDIHFLRELRRRVVGEPDEPGLCLSVLGEDELERLLVHEGNLTPDERMEIQRHPAESQRILSHIPFPENFSRLLAIIHQHHERLDGSGYPAALSGEQILLQSRILAVVDIYDAITQKRHYKPALARTQALDILGREALAGKIDHRLVEIFRERIDEIEELASRLQKCQTLASAVPPAVVVRKKRLTLRELTAL